jgi:hypothetical protein
MCQRFRRAGCESAPGETLSGSADFTHRDETLRRGDSFLQVILRTSLLGFPPPPVLPIMHQQLAEAACLKQKKPVTQALPFHFAASDFARQQNTGNAQKGFPSTGTPRRPWGVSHNFVETHTIGTHQNELEGGNPMFFHHLDVN